MKIKEIEERWDYPNADKLDWNNAKDDIDSLLSECKRLEKERERLSKLLIEARTEIVELRERVKELEAIERLSRDSIMKMYDSKERAEARVKELEEGIERYLNDPEFNTEILTELIKKKGP